jgi:hypothetical protein
MMGGAGAGPRWAERQRSDGVSGALGQELRGRLRTSVKLGLNKNIQEMVGREKNKGERFFLFEKQPYQMNSNTNLNLSTQKQCTSMYATMNSYISLFN